MWTAKNPKVGEPVEEAYVRSHCQSKPPREAGHSSLLTTDIHSQKQRNNKQASQTTGLETGAEICLPSSSRPTRYVCFCAELRNTA